jgi:thiol-disulfide isomerase/thioredoxin
MKTTFLLAAVLTLGSNVFAQFYAPDTEFHDRSQRTFPVEAARVLADRQNASGARIASISYAVVTQPDGETVWTLQWLDAAKKPLREKTVRYPQSLLTEGPKFFLEVLSQLTADDWAIDPAPPDQAATAFWKGAEGAGVSRLDALANAGRALAANPKVSAPADAARLAGILSQGVAPAISTAYTIDGVMLARAAAWLAIAEAASGEKLDAQWCPLLFLAGREPAAAKLWSAQPQQPADKLTAPERMWDFLLRPHGATEAFLFAAAPENKTVAMPVMAYASNMDNRWSKLTAAVAGDLLDDELLARLHEYMVIFAIRAGVDGGHFASDAPGEFLTAWEDTLKTLQPSALEDAAWRTPFSDAQTARPEADESATMALQRLAPVLNLGLDQRGAPLVPTGCVTAADLLGYGWEMAARQFGAQHNFLEARLGDPDAAREVAAAALGTLRGCDIFFTKPDAKPKEPLTDFRRLELTNAQAAHARIVEKLPPEWKQPPDHYLRRTWLAGGAEQAVLEQMMGGTAPDSVTEPLLQRLFAEGGANALWQLPLLVRKNRHPTAIKRLDLINRVAAAAPWSIHTQVVAAYEELAVKEKKSFEYARRLEELGWQNLTAVEEAEIFCRYVGAHAYDAARRFYDAIVPFVSDTVAFSNNGAPGRFLFAWWELDDAGMRRAMADGATYSWRDLSTQVAYALHSGKLDEAERLISAIIERYGDNKGTLAKFRAWLPLVPALKDPKHPDHDKAISSFAVSDYGWVPTQFMLARDAKLTNEEAVRFFDRPQASVHAKMIIAWLQGDKGAFEREYPKGSAGNGAMAVLAELMRNDLLETAPRADVPDIKPRDVRPLSSVLIDLRGKKESAELTAALDLSKYKSADELWAFVEKLKVPPTERPRSRDDMLKLVRRWLENQSAAAGAFVKAWPNDPRHWDARLLTVTTTAQLDQLRGRTPDAAAMQREIDAVLAAPDAHPSAKGEAAYLQLMGKTAEVNPDAPHSFVPFHRAADEYLANYGSHVHAEEVARMQIEMVEMREQPGAENILKKLAAHPNQRIATLAKETLSARERVASLRTTPLALTVPATDGSEIDFAKLRGKVVLLDFWASWSRPSMAEMPAIVQAYTQLRGKGFEIVGVSLDQDREAMEGALKKSGASWPQHFDGTGWQNKVARQFGVRAVPSSWLFDKKGLLRETQLDGDELTASVEKLLRE